MSKLSPLVFAAVAIVLLFCQSSARAQVSGVAVQNPPLTITVDAKQVIRTDADKFVGIDINYIRDLDNNRPAGSRPLVDALGDMGAKWLRYPGGEKSNYYQWSQPPFAQPNPVSLGTYAKFPGQRMDFDTYISAARAVKAEPFVVVGFSPSQQIGVSLQEWINSASAWVKYANITRKYHVRYWEIGNENWCNKPLTAAVAAQDIVLFSKAMKAVDPTIKIGASGDTDSWWRAFLPVASSSLDFLVESDYPCWNWKSYEAFEQNPDLAGVIETAETAIDRYALPADKDRLRVVATEVNSADFSSGSWPGSNNLGHSLVTFDTLGQAMLQPRSVCAMVWTTRWMDDNEASSSLWYSLAPNNQLLPTGRAVALWGKFVQPDLIAVTGGSKLVSGYACRSNDFKSMTVWLINRSSTSPASISLSISSPTTYKQVSRYVFTGSGPDDPSPGWSTVDDSTTLNPNSVQNIELPNVSVTVLTFDRKKIKL